MKTAELKLQGAKKLLSAFEKKGGISFLHSNKEEAKRRFVDYGIPTKKDEYWRFTPPKYFLEKVNSREALLGSSSELRQENSNDLTLVFVDGKFSSHLSDDIPEDAIELHSLEGLDEENIEWIKSLYGLIEMDSQTKAIRSMAAFNTACATNGLLIRVKKTIKKNVVIKYMLKEASSSSLIHNLIKIDPNNSFTLIEDGESALFANQVMEVEIGESANFDHIRLQGSQKISTILTQNYVRQEKNSSFKSFSLNLNGSMTRNESFISLEGNDCRMSVAGAFLGANNDHNDDTVFISHNSENCESRQVFKKVLRDNSTGVFQGKILVEPAAQKTDGYQVSKGLLLNPESNFLAKPELEIYADDVVCSHGSTCGAIDEDNIFYLISRGIPRKSAEEMLIMAFLDEAVSEITDIQIAEEVRSLLIRELEKKIAQI